MAVFMPIPNARVTMAMREKTGFLMSALSANFRSFMGMAVSGVLLFAGGMPTTLNCVSNLPSLYYLVLLSVKCPNLTHIRYFSLPLMGQLAQSPGTGQERGKMHHLWPCPF